MSATHECACCAPVSLEPETPGRQNFSAVYAEHRQEILVLAGSALIFALALIFEGAIERAFGPWGGRVLFAVPYLLCGLPIAKEAVEAALKGDLFNEFMLMFGATVAAICLDQMAEAVGVMLFYRIGELFQDIAAAGSRRSIRNLLASKPTTANVLRNGEVACVAVESVEPGAEFIVRAGESVPLDGEVLSGVSQVDQSPLTGESMPVAVAAGDTVMGGTLNMEGVLTVRATKAFADTHMARVLELVENAASNKAPTERFITRFARYYTPAVVALAFLVAVLPPLLGGADWRTWIYRALVMLVISCPCALVISIPLSYFGGIGAASKRGILVKGGTVLDGLTHVDTVVFDKTGTLTQGVFALVVIEPAHGVSEDELLYAAAVAESDSNHPVARSIMRRAGEGFVRPAGAQVCEASGKGMVAEFGGSRYLAGTEALLAEHGVSVSENDRQGTLVHVAKDARYLGCLTVADMLKPDAEAAVAAIRGQGHKTYMLTGDREEVAASVAAGLGLDGYTAGLLPEGKVKALDGLAARERVAFVGDGINDAPILALSRVGIAMGGVGAQAAVEAADAVILNDAPSKVAELLALARKVRGIVWQNIFMALGVKGLFMALGVVGLSGLWEAVFADVGVALLAVLNATRATRQ